MLTLFSNMVWAFVLGPTIASMLLLFILFITTSFSHCKLVVVWIYEQVRFQSYRWTRATLFYLSAFTLWMSLCALARVISAELHQKAMHLITSITFSFLLKSTTADLDGLVVTTDRVDKLSNHYNITNQPAPKSDVVVAICKMTLLLMTIYFYYLFSLVFIYLL